MGAPGMLATRWMPSVDKPGPNRRQWSPLSPLPTGETPVAPNGLPKSGYRTAFKAFNTIAGVHAKATKRIMYMTSARPQLHFALLKSGHMATTMPASKQAPASIAN